MRKSLARSAAALAFIGSAYAAQAQTEQFTFPNTGYFVVEPKFTSYRLTAAFRLAMADHPLVIGDTVMWSSLKTGAPSSMALAAQFSENEKSCFVFKLKGEDILEIERVVMDPFGKAAKEPVVQADNQPYAKFCVDGSETVPAQSAAALQNVFLLDAQTVAAYAKQFPAGSAIPALTFIYAQRLTLP